MSKSWEGGSTRAWRRVRLFVLQRDAYSCRLKLEGCLGRASQAHHVLGRKVTGDDPTFIIASCPPCNLTVGDPTAGDPPASPPLTAW